MKKRFIFAIAVIFIFLSCSNEQQLFQIVRTRLIMGTVVQIKVYNELQDIEQVIAEAFTAIEEVNLLASNYNDSSTVSLINRDAYKHYIKIDTNLVNIIELSQHISELTAGAFDITISPLLKLWNYNDSIPKIPSEKEIQQALAFVNYKNISLKDNEIKFSKQGMKIDLGGIAKGYAVDKAIEVLKKHGIEDALIDAGGDIRAICGKLTKGNRKVWIKHPRRKGYLFGYFNMDDGSVATSGDYEQFFFVDSVRYHHILDSKTGYPANNCVSVTIRANKAMMADALATAVFLISPEKGMNLIDQFDDVEGIIIIEKNGNLEYILSSGLIGKFFRKDEPM